MLKDRTLVCCECGKYVMTSSFRLRCRQLHLAQCNCRGCLSPVGDVIPSPSKSHQAALDTHSKLRGELGVDQADEDPYSPWAGQSRVDTINLDFSSLDSSGESTDNNRETTYTKH